MKKTAIASTKKEEEMMPRGVGGRRALLLRRQSLQEWGHDVFVWGSLVMCFCQHRWNNPSFHNSAGAGPHPGPSP
jgi:hypothetical protein